MSKFLPVLLFVAGAAVLYGVARSGSAPVTDHPGALPPLQGESIAGPTLPVADEPTDEPEIDPFSLLDDEAVDEGAEDGGAAADEPVAARPAPQRLRPGAAAAASPDAGDAAASGAVAATEAAPTEGGARFLPWEEISFFEYEPPDVDAEEGDEDEDSVGKANQQIPAEVRALQDKLVSIEGYMMPLEVKDGKVRSFILARHVFGCCFGVVPKINEWVSVEVAGEEGVHAVSYDTVLVTGHLEVGGVMDEFGYMFSIYQILDAEVSARR